MKKEEKVINDLTEKTISDFTDLIFGNLDKIYEVCETSAKGFDSKSIPLTLLKTCINETKKGFKIGIKK